MKKLFCVLLVGKALHSSQLVGTVDADSIEKRIHPQKFLDDMAYAEHELFDKHSGLKVGKTIQIYDVPIVLNGKEEKIHTVRSGDDQKEDLVLIHGYFLGLLSFFKMTEDLSKHYRIWCIDLVGMGLSSRPDFTCQSTEETTEYFVESIEQWRKSVGIEKFHLAGHSLGGYMSGMYALKHPDRVNKLLLLSPAGVSKSMTEEEVDKELNKLPWFQRKLWEYYIGWWGKKSTVHDWMNSIGIFKNPVISMYVKGVGFRGDQADFGYRYLSGILHLPESSLKCLHHVFKCAYTSGHIPLENHMHKFKMPCEIYYGDADWMSMDGSSRVATRGELKGNIHVIPNAGHLMNFENPKYVTQLMVKHLKEPENKQ